MTWIAAEPPCVGISEITPCVGIKEPEMSRRKIENWEARPVSEFEVAPHRYLWTDGQDSDPDIRKFSDWLKTVPYQAGEVVWLEHKGKPVKARIMQVFRDYNRWQEAREMYRVQIETAKGHWSKAWFYTWSGFIQRGYKLAGLAPDVPD